MAIHYHCRHCGMKIGTIDKEEVDTSRLGLQILTNDERTEMITYHQSGDLYVKAICEDCHETLTRNPDYYENDYIIH